MNGLIQAIRRVLQAMASAPVAWVKVAGRWILRAIPRVGIIGDTPAGPSTSAIAAAATPSTADHSLLKSLAGRMAAGLMIEATDLARLPDLAFRWLRVMDRPALCCVAAADTQQIDAHVRGIARIRGVVPYDRASVEDHEHAAALAAKMKAARPTLRGALAEKGIYVE